MALYYKISDFNISSMDIPELISDKILQHHIIPMSFVQSKAPFHIYPSARSGFRPYVWEIARGRSGKSQHTFGQKKSGVIYENELGAVDWTCEDFLDNKDCLLDLIIKETNYLRISVYNSFIHCDYKNTHKNKRLLFKADTKGKWKFIRFIK
jgi:hypothetical protein